MHLFLHRAPKQAILSCIGGSGHRLLPTGRIWVKQAGSGAGGIATFFGTLEQSWG